MRSAKRDRCGRQHLVAVGDQQQQVGPPRGQCVGQAEDREPDRLGHPRVGVGAEQALDPCLDRKAVAFDLVNGCPELRRQMRAQGEYAQIDAGCPASSRSGQ